MLVKYIILTHYNSTYKKMYTIKESSAMMLFHSISTLAHTLEAIF